MQKIYIANWKSFVDRPGALQWIYQVQCSVDLFEDARIVVCPPYPLLPLIEPIRKNNIFLGAQACSECGKGAFTGEVCAELLAQMGCTYCIVGHSERRTMFGQTPSKVNEQIKQLQQHNMCPIICVGETYAGQYLEDIKTVLAQQMDACLSVLSRTCIIAYEPCWAIGTGVLPTEGHLKVIMEWMHDFLVSQRLSYSISLVYGGSVSEENAAFFKEIEIVAGFLLGRSSTDFQTFKNIVCSQ
jgi:triosephosphate isomerase (TIM)